MGNYTGLEIEAKVRPSLPIGWCQFLFTLIRGYLPDERPDDCIVLDDARTRRFAGFAESRGIDISHPFFQAANFTDITGKFAPPYYPDIAGKESVFRHVVTEHEEYWTLGIYSIFKNHERLDEKFLDWLSPYFEHWRLHLECDEGIVIDKCSHSEYAESESIIAPK